MHNLRTAVVLLFISLPCWAQGAIPANEAPLIEDGAIKVDAGDVFGYLMRVPEERRGNFLTSYDRIATVADAVFVSRSLAAKAKAEGLDQDPAVQRRMQQAQDAVLADLYVQKVQKELKNVNLEKRARELYLAEPEKYTSAPQVALEHILIGLKGRTKEMARERANEVYAKAATGKEEFLTLAARYSDDPSKNQNGGSLGYSGVKAFTPEVRDAIEKLGAKGEVSKPVESEAGFHVFRLVDKKPPELAKFDAVKEKIIETERERLQKQRADSVVQDIRSSPTVLTHRGNVEALVVPIDAEALKRIQDLHNKGR